MLLSEEYEGKHLPPPSKPQPVDKPIIFNDLDSIHHKGMYIDSFSSLTRGCVLSLFQK